MKKKKSTLLIVGMSFLLSIGTLMFSSCADKDDPSPILPTPEDTSYILKLKFSEKVEFKEILNKKRYSRPNRNRNCIFRRTNPTVLPP